MRKDVNDEGKIQEAVELFNTCIPIFSVLADVNRQHIIIALAEADRLNVGQLDQMMKLSRPAISHHLKVLKSAGIVDSEKSGTENYYFLTLRDAVDLMKRLTLIIEDTCFLK